MSFDPLIRSHPRIYAVASRNKMVVVYFAALMLARLSTELVIIFIKPPVVVDIHLIPADAFNLCMVTIDLQLMLIPNSIGTAFGAWSHSFQLLT